MQDARRAQRAVTLAACLSVACSVGIPARAGISNSQAATDPVGGAYSGFLAGRFAASQSDPGTASQDYLRALALDPSEPALQRQAFLACLASGAPESVGLARLLPDDQIATLLLADTALLEGDWQTAESRFRSLREDGTIEVIRPLLVAWTEQGSGQSDAALATLQPLIDGSRLRALYALHAGLIAETAGRMEAAADFYRKERDLGGVPSLRVEQVLASFLARTGHPAESMHVLAEAGEFAPEISIALPDLVAAVSRPAVSGPVDGIAEAYLAMAGTLQQQGDSEQAMLLLRLALGLRPGLTAARIMTADILDAQGHPDRALQTLADVAPKDPLIAVVRMRRAGIDAHAGRTDVALREFADLARDYPQSPLPLAEEGGLLRSKDRFAEAITTYDRAIARVPSPSRVDWVLFYELGIAHDRAHQWGLAESDFKHALQLSPNQPLLLNYIGYSWADMGVHLPEARQMIEQAAQLDPNDGAIVDSLGWVALRMGNVPAAVHTLERAAELQPEDPTVNGHLGDAYWAAGRKLEASYQWRRALTLNPEPQDAAKLRAKLDDSLRQAAATPAALDMRSSVSGNHPVH
jgi:tetratricopeptide (TPR) repeat protein